ncbi:MAG: apolipoprotein N-acyltransferase [Rhodospirillaceae bacterium]
MDRLIQGLAALGGWRRLVVAFLAGAFTIVAFQPISIVPALWIAFPILFWLLDGCRTWRSAFLTGWAFGAGYFITALYWMASAFYVDAEAFGVFAIPAVGSLSVAMGLFIAIVCALSHLLLPPAPIDEMSYDRAAVTTRRVVLFAAIWTLVEWIRSWIFTGLPWNPLGLVWSETHTPVGVAMIQVTALIGTYGLSFLTLVLAGAPAVLYGPRLPRAWITAATPLALMIAIGAGGGVRLALAHDDVVPGVKLRLVQANFSQADRSRPSLWAEHLKDYVRMSNENRPADVTHVIWGEAAVAFFLNIQDEARRLAAVAAPPSGMLITGADRGIRHDDGRQSVFNSLYAITPDANIAAVYDKTHLVPFGEYTPLREIVPFDEITGMSGGFAAGSGLATLAVPGLPPFSPLICYEVIFSGDVTAAGEPRPAWLLNLTNDAWFGMTFGPHQHFAQARLRAAEEGLPLVRTANTGISAAIDGYGRVLQSLPLGTRGVLDVPLPKPAAAVTPFALLGNLTSILLATCGGAGALFFRRGDTWLRLRRAFQRGTSAPYRQKR